MSLLLAHHLCLRSKLRFSAHGWRLTPPRHDCRTAPQPILYLPSHYITPFFFHPLLDGEKMPSPELPNLFQLTTNKSLLQITRAASSLLLSLTFNAPPKFKLRSPLLFLLSPFWMRIKLRPTLTTYDSLMAPLSKDRLRGM